MVATGLGALGLSATDPEELEKALREVGREGGREGGRAGGRAGGRVGGRARGRAGHLGGRGDEWREMDASLLCLF